MSKVFTGKYWTIQNFVSGFANNAYLITCNRTNDSVVIDTPAQPTELVTAASATNLRTILITHSHRDHVEGYQSVGNANGPVVGIGKDDRSSLPSTAPTTLDVSTNQQITVGDISIRAMATPGHTPGSRPRFAMTSTR